MRIAALDDEPNQLELIRLTMEGLGHECHGFAEGKNLLDDTQYRFTPHEYREIAPETTMRWDDTFVGRKY